VQKFLALGLCAALCGCGGSGERLVPTLPRDAVPVITTPDTFIYIGQTVTFAASGANLRWGSDAPGVATVDPATGRTTVVGSGRVTIWAENDAGRTTRLLRGLPSFSGEWHGSYEVIGCQSSGHWSDSGFCTGSPWEFGFRVGDVFDISLNLRQTDDRITGGAFELGGNNMPTGLFAPASVPESGVLSLAVQAAPGRHDGVDLENVRFEFLTGGTISGTFDQVWSVPGQTGNGRLICRLRDVTTGAH
jgi:hypothetical protein